MFVLWFKASAYYFSIFKLSVLLASYIQSKSFFYGHIIKGIIRIHISNKGRQYDGQRNKDIWSTKHYTENQRLSNISQTKNGGELMHSKGVNSSCSTVLKTLPLLVDYYSLRVWSTWSQCLSTDMVYQICLKFRVPKWGIFLKLRSIFRHRLNLLTLAVLLRSKWFVWPQRIYII